MFYKKKEKPGHGKMLVSHILRSVYRLKIMAEGVNCEKLISEIISRGIQIREVRVIDETTVIFVCSASEYPVVSEAAGRKYELGILERQGLIPEVKDKLNGRGIAAGLFLIMLLMFLSQLFITEIEIKGNVGITETEIRETAAENGLKEYRIKYQYDKDEVKSALFSAFKDITWINIVEKGSYVLIELVEGNKITKQENGDVLHDLVAAKDGYVEEIIVKNGYKLINEGDYVKAGQIMVSSGVPVNNTTYDTSRDGMIRYVDASGIVKARVIYKLNFQCEADKYTEDELKSVVDDKTRAYIRENIPELIEIRKNDLKFDIEENIIKGVVTLEVVERIDIQKETAENTDLQKENEFAENVEWYNG